jgi:hypothetical protein
MRLPSVVGPRSEGYTPRSEEPGEALSVTR